MNWLKLATSALFSLAVPAATASAGHTVGQPDFAFTCSLGRKSVRGTTESGQLVYRYGSAGHPELVIRGGPDSRTLYFLKEMGRRSDAQQLRFVNGEYSYVLSSLFVAAAGGEDRVKFHVLRGDRVIRSQLCRDAASFEDFYQLERLPRDPVVPFLDR